MIELLVLFKSGIEKKYAIKIRENETAVDQVKEINSSLLTVAVNKTPGSFSVIDIENNNSFIIMLESVDSIRYLT